MNTTHPSAAPAISGRRDLHCHSSASDGRLSPAALVEAAAGAGLTLLALTDHDTIDGLEPAQDAARRLGLDLVTGVEISVRWRQRPLHLVGLDFDPATAELIAGLRRLQAQRRARAAAMGAKLERLGVTNALERAAQQAGGGQITRTHFARLLVEDGRCKTMQSAFDRYLGPGKPAYAATEWVPMAEAVNWLRRAGGLAVIAHPQQYRLGGTARASLMDDFRAAGGVGLEVCSGNSSADDVRRCASDALRCGLLGSVGSDFHGPEQHWLRLGGTPPLPTAVEPIWTHFRSRPETVD